MSTTFADASQSQAQAAPAVAPAAGAATDAYDDHHDHAQQGFQHNSQQPHDFAVVAAADMAVRSLVSTKEAGIVIGKAGSNVAHIRELTAVKVGVSKVVPGVSERILNVVGPIANVAKAYAMIAKNLLESNPASPSQPNPAAPTPSDATTIRLLVAHQLVGSVIGKAGAKIREIQEASGAKIVVSKEMLPQSTERVVEIYGLVDSIHLAVYHIGQCIKSDAERAANIILYDPQSAMRMHPTGAALMHGGQPMTRRAQHHGQPAGSPTSPAGARGAPAGAAVVPMVAPAASPNDHAAAASAPGAETQSRALSVPADMVGCIIGKGGSFINQIRRLSGAKLHIAEQLEGRTDREVTITGTEAANQKALSLLYNQLDAEKQRRISLAAASAVPVNGAVGGPEDDSRVQR
ncbi:hypothetical protein BC831DRAFT_469215 [Entophlyctis helioformis]|nr:hypothetical protein BC831DRAFT_469215 [Entophlyctis helioformis]